MDGEHGTRELEQPAAATAGKPRRVVIEGFRPAGESLEWRVAAAYWDAAGARAFHADTVPHLITTDGMLAARAADVLLESCLLAERAGTLEDDIAVLELGAGLGVYARQFLDRFEAVCAELGRDFHERMTYHVSDRFARMLDDIVSAGTLEPHAGRVRLGCVDALDPATFAPHDGGAPVQLGGLRAIVHSYVLDGLPFDVVLRSGGSWLRLHYRTSIEDADAELAERLAQRPRDADAPPSDLLDIADRLVVEQAYLPLDPGELPFGALLDAYADSREAAGGVEEVSFIHSHGALTSLTRGLELLVAGGFVLFHDYGSADAGAGPEKHQRFARSRAVPLNLGLIDHALAQAGHDVFVPDGDGQAPIHTRLVCAGAAPDLEQAFRASFDLAALRRLGALLREARGLRESDPDGARDAYRRANEAAPENWHVLVDWAEFELGLCEDPDAALVLAEHAAAMNPTGATRIHDVRGDAHAAIGQLDEAAAAYRQALGLYADDVRARSGIARLHAYEGRYREAIVELGGAIACDRAGAHRALLLGRLEQVLDMRAEAGG